MPAMKQFSCNTHFITVPTVPFLVVVITREVNERQRSSLPIPNSPDTMCTVPDELSDTVLPPEICNKIKHAYMHTHAVIHMNFK